MYFCQMKHIIIILSSAILLLTSCGKKPKCWECTLTITRQDKPYATNVPKVSTNEFKLCDHTRKDIEHYMKVNTTYTPTINTVSVVTECH